MRLRDALRSGAAARAAQQVACWWFSKPGSECGTEHLELWP